MTKRTNYKSGKGTLVFIWVSMVLLTLLLINSYRRWMELEKEIQEIHITYERRQKEYDKKEKQQRAEIERMLKEIKAKK